LFQNFLKIKKRDVFLFGKKKKKESKINGLEKVFILKA